MVGTTDSAMSKKPALSNGDSDEEMKKVGIEDLRKIQSEQHEWVKVHAAEFLLQLGQPEGVKEAFVSENEQFGDKAPYRIGIWRVLAQAETSEQKKQRWVGKIKKAFLDPRGSDRLHAIETLAKLKTSIQDEHPSEVEEALNSDAEPMALYAKWSTAYADEQSLPSVRSHFVKLLLSAELDDPDQAEKIRLSSYVLRFLGAPEVFEWESLARKVVRDTSASSGRSLLLATLYITHPVGAEEQLMKEVKEKLVEMSGKKSNAANIMIALAERGDGSDLATMRQWFDRMRDTDAVDYDADLHATAAFSFARLVTRMQDTK